MRFVQALMTLMLLGTPGVPPKTDVDVARPVVESPRMQQEIPGIEAVIDRLTERIKRPKDVDQTLQAARMPAHLMNFYLATVDDLTLLGLGKPVYIPIQITDRPGGRKSIYELRPGEETLTGIYVTERGVALKYVKRVTGAGLPKVGDSYSTRVVRPNGALLFGGPGKLVSFDAKKGMGEIKYEIPSEVTPMRIIIIIESSKLWSCFKKTVVIMR
jgi:hypothetical protein